MSDSERLAETLRRIAREYEIDGRSTGDMDRLREVSDRLEELELTLQSERRIEEVLLSSFDGINFMNERRKKCFQMIGKYDGAMSEECKAEFRTEYELWDAMIKKTEEGNYEQ